MNRLVRTHFIAALCLLLFVGSPALPQSLKLKWSKEFSQRVSWYVRTSPGILLVKAGKSVIAVDEVEGRQLWMFPVVETTFGALGGLNAAADRGRNIVEVPGMGVLLLNRVKLPGDSDGQLIAVNLLTGKRLWDAPQVDDLMTAVPLYESGEVILVLRRFQKKAYAEAMAVSAGAQLPLVIPIQLYYPYRFELERVDLSTGKLQWSTEYERTFSPGTATVKVFGDHLFVYFGNHVLGCVDSTTGKVLWADGSKLFGTTSIALPLEMANGRLIYGAKDVQAIDPVTQKADWRIYDLGKFTGILVHDGLTVAIGEKNIAAMDTSSGTERWRRKTHGHTTNLAWDRKSDAVLYTDWQGLHSVERTTGKGLLDAKLDVESFPYHIRLASPEVVVTIAVAEVCAYNFKTGKKLFSAGKLASLFRPDAILDNWPMPEDGEELVQMGGRPSGVAEWEGVRKGTLLSPEALKKFEDSSEEIDEYLEAYETEFKGPVHKLWWIDPETNGRVVIAPSGEHHHVDRRLGMVIAVNGKGMLGA